tara:strand:+ start:151 stop:858 length:708 start_codon:yes stop_codon:yes gene_type:complete
MRIAAFFASVILLLSTCIAKTDHTPDAFDQREILHNAEYTLENFLTRSDERILNNLIVQAKALVIFPDLVKASIIAGSRYGRGIVVVRSKDNRKWRQPAFVKSLQISWGLQAGIEHAELVLIVVSLRGVKALRQTHYNLDIGPEIAHGPVEKLINFSPQKFLKTKDIYAYSMINKSFTEISWKGTYIQEDEEANKNFYRRPISHRSLLLSDNINIPQAGINFMRKLDKIAPPEKR